MVDESKLLRQLKQKQGKSINQAIEIYTPYLSTVLFNMVGNGLYLNRSPLPPKPNDLDDNLGHSVFCSIEKYLILKKS